MRFGIWRSAVAPSDVAEKKRQYRCTTTVPRVHKSPKDILKIYFLYDFWCAQTCSFLAIFGLHVQILTLAISAYSEVRNYFFILM